MLSGGTTWMAKCWALKIIHNDKTSSRVCVDHVIELQDGVACAMVKLGISLCDGNQQKSRAIVIILIATIQFWSW